VSELEIVREELTRAREELRALEDSRAALEGSRAALESSRVALEDLRREVEELRQAHEKATSDREQYRALYMQLLERCRALEQGIIAGKKAERFAGEGANQLSMQLLGMLLAEGEAPAEENAGEGDDDLDLGDLEDADDDVAATDGPGDTSLPKRRRRGRRKLPEALPRVEIEILPEEVRREGLDAFKRIGEVVSEAVERRPASLVVLRFIRPKFVHKETPEPDPHAEDDGEPEAPVVLVAEPPEKPIERGLAGPGLLAATIVQRWQDHRQAELAEPLVDAMMADAFESPYVCVDATGVLVQAPEQCQRCHFWVLVAPERHVLYRFSPRHDVHARPAGAAGR